MGCANPDMRHYNVEYICNRTGTTAVYCEQHKCPGENTCCKPINGSVLRIDFRASCDDCGKQAHYHHGQRFEEGGKVDVFYCYYHKHGDDRKCCEIIYDYITSMIDKLNKEKEREDMAKKKKGKAFEEEEEEGESRNRRGDPCPIRVKKRGRPKKGKKSAGTVKCGKFTPYYCSEQQQFICFDHNHMTLKQRECCTYIVDSYSSEDRGRVGWSEFGPPSADAKGGSWDDSGADTKVENPCTKCKDEGTYWCSKAGEWRCSLHMHTRWDCCGYADDKRKTMKEVVFDNANA